MTSQNPARRHRYVIATTLAATIIACVWQVLWFRNQVRQYHLDRELIAAILHGDVSAATRAIDAGADPNTPFAAPSKPSLALYLRRLRHLEEPAAHTPSAFMLVIGDCWWDSSDYGNQQSLNLINRDTSPEELDSLAELMVKHGADILKRGAGGESPLHLAASSSQSRTVAVLIKHGVEVNAGDDFGWTPVQFAIDNGASQEVVKYLIEHGAKLDTLTNEGENCLSIAERGGKTDIATLIRAHGGREPSVKPVRVPAIASLLTKRVAANGRESLERIFGVGVYSIGGHSNSVEDWRTINPQATIYTDGFTYNSEGEVLETVAWSLERPDPSIPTVKRLPPHSGWLGEIEPGMSMQRVEEIAAKLHQRPEKSGDKWRWVARGYVKPSEVNHDVFKVWVADLTFNKGVLGDIYLESRSELLPARER